MPNKKMLVFNNNYMFFSGKIEALLSQSPNFQRTYVIFSYPSFFSVCTFSKKLFPFCTFSNIHDT